MFGKNTGIALAQEIAEAGKESIFDLESMELAGEIFKLAPSEEMKQLLWKYSGTLAAMVSTRIVSILMTESDFNHMVSEIEMFDEIERDVMGN